MFNFRCPPVAINFTSSQLKHLHIQEKIQTNEHQWNVIVNKNEPSCFCYQYVNVTKQFLCTLPWCHYISTSSISGMILETFNPHLYLGTPFQTHGQDTCFKQTTFYDNKFFLKTYQKLEQNLCKNPTQCIRKNQDCTSGKLIGWSEGKRRRKCRK